MRRKNYLKNYIFLSVTDFILIYLNTDKYDFLNIIAFKSLHPIGSTNLFIKIITDVESSINIF